MALVHWPAEEDRREELPPWRTATAPSGRARGRRPIPTDGLEDWIRLPADDIDLRVGVEALRRRADSGSSTRPELDDDGVLRVGDRWVSLLPVEARLTEALLDRFGAVVSREALARPLAGRVAGAQRLDVHVLRLAAGSRRCSSRSAWCGRGPTLLQAVDLGQVFAPGRNGNGTLIR